MPGRQVILLFLLSFTPTANAEIYTWVDSKGVSHFTDRKPERREPELLEVGQPSLLPMRENITRGKRVTTIHQQVVRSLEASSTGRPTRTEKQKAREQQHKKARCNGYRKKLGRIQRQLRAGYSNSKGNRLRQQRRDFSEKLSRECLLD
jgi:hypothetical protein